MKGRQEEAESQFEFGGEGAKYGESLIRLRISEADCHYAGGLASGAKVLELFGDAATELSIRVDRDEGLFRAYESVEFLAPVRAGDFLEVRGRVIAVGKTSRRMVFEAHRVIEPDPGESQTGGRLLSDPVLVARAIGTTVTPAERQRGGNAGQ